MPQVTKDLPDWVFGYALLPRTALRPNQSPYFATTSLTITALSSVEFTIEAGYAKNLEWIPAGRRFSIWFACFTIDQNSLIRTQIGVEEKTAPGVITALAKKFGYGQAEYLSGVLFDFEPDTRPVYTVANYSGVDVTLDFTVFGIEEVML